jgi:hypothetical protein
VVPSYRRGAGMKKCPECGWVLIVHRQGGKVGKDVIKTKCCGREVMVAVFGEGHVGFARYAERSFITEKINHKEGRKL